MAKKQMTVEELKKKHGTVYEIKVDDKIGYLRKPDRNTLRLAFSKATTDPLGMTEVILENCWLQGDEEILNDDSYFLGAVGQIDKIMEARNGELKKL
jgi:hypothetical protein